MDELILDPSGAIILEKYLIVSDLHIGIERELGLSRGANTNLIINKLDKLKEKYNVESLIMAGDVKHRFDLSDFKLIEYFLKNISKRFQEIIWVGGNHDSGARYLEVEVVEKFSYKNYIIEHGDKLNLKGKKTRIIGHEHPVIEIRTDYKSARYICFLVFEKVIVMPAFNNISPGNNVLTSKFSNDQLNKKRWEAEVYISDEENIYRAGKLKDIAVRIYGELPEI